MGSSLGVELLCVTVFPHCHFAVNYCHAQQKRSELVLNLDCTDMHKSYLIYTFGASISTSCCSAQARRYVIHGKIFVLTLKLPKYLNKTLLVTVGGNLHQNAVNQSRFKTWNCLALQTPTKDCNQDHFY